MARIGHVDLRTKRGLRCAIMLLIGGMGYRPTYFVGTVPRTLSSLPPGTVYPESRWILGSPRLATGLGPFERGPIEWTGKSFNYAAI